MFFTWVYNLYLCSIYCGALCLKLLEVRRFRLQQGGLVNIIITLQHHHAAVTRNCSDQHKQWLIGDIKFSFLTNCSNHHHGLWHHSFTWGQSLLHISKQNRNTLASWQMTSSPHDSVAKFMWPRVAKICQSLMLSTGGESSNVVHFTS